MTQNTQNQDWTKETEQADVMLIDRNDIASVNLLESLQNPGTQFFCSIKDDGTRKSRVAIYNAINNAEEQLIQHINEELAIVDVVAHEVVLPDMQTGEAVRCLRTVLISADGKGYQAVSEGVTSALSKIFSIVGLPSWADEPVIIKPKQITTKKGFKVTTLELIG